MITTVKPLVYSCSGCSNVAQLANDVAVVMDRSWRGRANEKLVDIAKSGRDILAIDGCRRLKIIPWRCMV